MNPARFLLFHLLQTAYNLQCLTQLYKGRLYVKLLMCPPAVSSEPITANVFCLFIDLPALPSGTAPFLYLQLYDRLRCIDN